MIVPGIVITNGWWIGSGSEAQINHAPMGSLREASPADVQVGPRPGVVTTINFEESPHSGKTEPRPFILFGGPPAIAGTAVLSNPTVQEWVRGVLGWDQEPDAGLAF